MVLSVEELADLQEAVEEHLTEIMVKFNQGGQIEELLKYLGLETLLGVEEETYKPYKAGRIIVFGASKAKPEELRKAAKECGIEKGRLEPYLGYEESKRFDFRTVQYDEKYALIICGPTPHSGISKGEYSSIITAIENEPGYPPVVRLDMSKPITRSAFSRALQDQLEKKVII